MINPVQRYYPLEEKTIPLYSIYTPPTAHITQTDTTLPKNKYTAILRVYGEHTGMAEKTRKQTTTETNKHTDTVDGIMIGKHTGMVEVRKHRSMVGVNPIYQGVSFHSPNQLRDPHPSTKFIFITQI
jgi:hypothetical protein